MNVMRRAGWALALALVCAAPALAQQAAPAEKQSLLGMIKEGMEWPAYFVLIFSIVVVSLIVEHFATVRRVTIAPPDQIRKAKQLIEGRNFRECLETLKKSSTYFAKTMTAALQHARHGFDAMHEAAVEKSGELSGQMFRKIEYLNILGNLGPLMGLLGTVLGMIFAFGAMSGTGGDANAGGLSRGISLALVNTLLGLGLAVIGLGMFGVCRNRVDSLTVSATVEALDLLEYFRPAGGAGRGESRAAKPEAATPRRPATTEPAAEAS